MLLDVRNIQVSYGLSQVIFGVSLAVSPGEVITLLGRNGMGKTTTIRAIVGLCPPHAGQIELMGRAVHGLAPHRIARLGVGLVPEGRHIFPNLSVQENLLMAHRPSAQPGQQWTLPRVLKSLSTSLRAIGSRWKSPVWGGAANACHWTSSDDKSEPADIR